MSRAAANQEPRTSKNPCRFYAAGFFVSISRLNLNWRVAPHCRAAASFIEPDNVGLGRYQLDGMD
jgi:hypothetical protein